MKEKIYTLLKGGAMGVAEAIPGVSGGTIAFITGIYERLLAAIGHVLDPGLLTLWRREGLAAVWKQIDGNFLLLLGGGMVVGLVTAIFSITGLLEHYPPVVWAFFFGLIVASAVYIFRQVGQWRALEILLLLVGALVAYFLTVLNPLSGSEQLWMVFLSGAIAISALILPGISGSFILILLGMYPIVLGAMRSLLSGDLSQLPIFVAFGLGCLAGLALFSRLLTYTFQRFPHPTLALLTGFMIGSLNKLWPWRNVLTTRTNSQGELVPLLEKNVLPASYEGDPLTLTVVAAILAGLALVWLLGRGEQENGGGEK